MLRKSQDWWRKSHFSPILGTYWEKTAYFKPRNNRINCFLEWTVLNYRIWDVKSQCRRICNDDEWGGIPLGRGWSFLQPQLCIIRGFSPWKTLIKFLYKATGLVLVSSSLQRGMTAAWGLAPSSGAPGTENTAQSQRCLLAWAITMCSDPLGRLTICLKPQMSVWRNDHWGMGSCSAICLSVEDVSP